MSEVLLNVGENWRPLEANIVEQQIAVAMMYVFTLFRAGTIQPSTAHKMVDWNGEPCLALAVDVKLSDYQLRRLRGEEGDFPGYPHLGFLSKDGLVYVAVPLRIIDTASSELVRDAISDFGDYDSEFRIGKLRDQAADAIEAGNEAEADALVDALVMDFKSKVV